MELFKILVYILGIYGCFQLIYGLKYYLKFLLGYILYIEEL